MYNGTLFTNQSSKNKFSKYGIELSKVPFAHYAVAAITHAGASSLRYFLINLQSIKLVANIIIDSMILLIIIPRDSLSVPYVFFISSIRAFSFVLSSKYCSGFSPFVGRPEISAIKFMSIDTSLSIHGIPHVPRKIIF